MSELGEYGGQPCNDRVEKRLQPVWNKFSHGDMVDRPLWVDGNALARMIFWRARLCKQSKTLP